MNRGKQSQGRRDAPGRSHGRERCECKPRHACTHMPSKMHAIGRIMMAAYTKNRCSMCLRKNAANYAHAMQEQTVSRDSGVQGIRGQHLDNNAFEDCCTSFPRNACRAHVYHNERHQGHSSACNLWPPNEEGNHACQT